MSHQFEAFKELLQRYRLVWQNAWARRHEMDAPHRQPHELQFLPAALALQETPVSPKPRMAMWLLISFALIALLWACFGKIDIVATATGKIVPSDRVKTIQPLETATVSAIYVKEGQHVKAGDPLIEFDTTSANADIEHLRNAVYDARLQVLRAQALLLDIDNPQDSSPTGKAPSLPALDDIPALRQTQEQALLFSEWQEYNTKQAQLNASLNAKQAEQRSVAESVHKLQRSLGITRQRENDYARLDKQNYIPRHDYLDARQKLIDQEGELASLQQQQLQLTSEMEEVKRQQLALKAETLKNLQDKLREGKQLTVQYQQELIKAEQQGKQRRLTAPVDGTVQQLATHTIGGVVTPAQALMTIVPEDNPLEVEAYVENKDIGFVYAGQEAEAKVETFPYTKYGTIHAEVTEVSNDAINDEKKGLIYTAHVKLDRTTIPVENKTVNLTPGMAVTVEIKTGKRRVMEYFLSPLMEYQSESFKER